MDRWLLVLALVGVGGQIRQYERSMGENIDSFVRVERGITKASCLCL